MPRLVDQDCPDSDHVGRSINGCEEVRNSIIVSVENWNQVCDLHSYKFAVVKFRCMMNMNVHLFSVMFLHRLALQD